MKLHPHFLLILFLSLLMLDKIIPQDSTLSKPEIKNYIQFLEKENGKLSEKELMNKPLDYIKKIASLRYQAYDKDYISIARLMKSRKGLGGGTLEAIDKMLGEKVTTLLRVHYLLEMKINSIKTEDYHSNSGITYPRVEINASILDIIKGINMFKQGDSITYCYSPELRTTNYRFQLGETVFAAIITADDKNGITDFLFYENDKKGEDASYGRYPIENGILIDRNNVWGYGKSVPWNEFKMKLTQDINNIITGR